MTERIQRLFIGELRKFWQYHPEYSEIVEHIQGKYSFRERPQFGLIIKNSSGNHVSLASDNYQGIVQSYVSLAHVEGYPGLSVEWIRENALAIQANNGLFPLNPGIYFLDFCTADGVPTDQEFYIDPILDVAAETLLKVNDTQYQLLQGKYLQGSLRLFRMPGNIPLIEGTDFTGDPDTGSIILQEELPYPEDFLSADYRYPGETTGPWLVEKDRALVDPLPGVVLSFGRRVSKGDRLAVIVTRNRQLAALEYGGRWEFTMDIDVIARDVHAQREILDLSMMYLWAIARPRLSSMGIEIATISTGGESEEPYDDNGDDYFYTGSVSIQIQTDWSTHIPLGIILRRVDPVQTYHTGNSTAVFNTPEYKSYSGLSDEQLNQTNLQFQLLSNMNLAPYDPFYTGKFALRFGVYGTGEMLR